MEVKKNPDGNFFLLPFEMRFRMMNHATSAVFARSNPSPISAIPTTRRFGSASSSFSSRFSGSSAFYCIKIKQKKIIKIKTHKKIISRLNLRKKKRENKIFHAGIKTTRHRTSVHNIWLFCRYIFIDQKWSLENWRKFFATFVTQRDTCTNSDDDNDHKNDNSSLYYFQSTFTSFQILFVSLMYAAGNHQNIDKYYKSAQRDADQHQKTPRCIHKWTAGRVRLLCRQDRQWLLWCDWIVKKFIISVCVSHFYFAGWCFFAVIAEYGL